MPKGETIKDLEELRKLATSDEGDEDPLECAIQLNFGTYSRKDVQWFPEEKLWHVFHYIDETEGDYTDAELGTETNILKALGNNALFRLL